MAIERQLRFLKRQDLNEYFKGSLHPEVSGQAKSGRLGLSVLTYATLTSSPGAYRGNCFFLKLMEGNLILSNAGLRVAPVAVLRWI